MKDKITSFMFKEGVITTKFGEPGMGMTNCSIFIMKKIMEDENSDNKI